MNKKGGKHHLTAPVGYDRALHIPNWMFRYALPLLPKDCIGSNDFFVFQTRRYAKDSVDITIAVAGIV